MRLTSKINIALRLYGYYNEGGKRGVLHRARTLLEYYRSRYPVAWRQSNSISALLAGNLYAMKELRRTYVRGIVGMDKELLPSCPLCLSVNHQCKDCAWKAVIGIKCYLFAEAHFLIPQDEGLSRARNFNSRWWKHRKIALRRWILLYRMAAKLMHEVE